MHKTNGITTSPRVYNRHYEKVGDNEPVCIEDGLPFEIPESWEWTRLGTLFQHNTGKALNSSNTKGISRQYITTSNLYWGFFKLDNLREMLFTDEETKKCSVSKGDLLVCEGGDIGRAAIWNYDYSMCIQNHIHKLRPYYSVSSDFYYYIFYVYKNSGLLGGKGIGIQGLSSNMLDRLLIPLPPLDEQSRIVSGIEKYEPLIAEYDKLEQQKSKLDSEIYDKLKKSILQYAIQGKLVPQDENDEPASELLKRIRAEKKAQLGKKYVDSYIYKGDDNCYYEHIDGKAKDDAIEVPFEIPYNWAWSRINMVFDLQAGKFISADNILPISNSDLYPCYGGNGLRGYVKQYNYEGDYPLIGRQGALCGNINRAIGKFYATEHAVTVTRYCKMNIDLICAFLQAMNLNQYSTATAQPGLAISNLNNLLFPLPPLGEQERIADRINEIFAKL